MEKSSKISILSIIILIGFTFGVIYHYVLGNYLQMDERYNTFLYPASKAQCDFTVALPFIRDFAPYQKATLWVVYFPLAYILLLPFALIKNLIVSYTAFISIFMTYLITMNVKFFSCENLAKLQNFQNIFILSLLSYPVLYNLDKGNFDMILFIFMGFWAFAFKDKKYMLSSVILSVINAIKPFTILFLFLYLFKKKYKEFLLSIILTTLMVFGGFMVFKGGFFDQIVILIKSVALFKPIYATGDAMKISWCSSLFIPLKTLILHISTAPSFVESFIKFYNYVSYIITAITVFFVWKEQSFWKQMTLLICNFILMPFVTYDYKFIFLYIPLWLFVNEEQKSKFDLAYILLFGLLFIPKNIIIYLPVIQSSTPSWISLSAILNPLILIAISILIIYEQYRKKDKKCLIAV